MARTIKLTVVIAKDYPSLSVSCSILFSILLSWLSLYTDEILGDHKYVFWYNRSSTDCIFCIHHILEEKWEYNGTVHELFM